MLHGSLSVADTTDKILGFLLTLFESLKVQIGPAVTEQIVQQLLHTFTRQQLSETLLHESSAGSRVINKFLKILQLLVQEPAASFKTFLPNIIGLCMEQLYPIIIEVSKDLTVNIVEERKYRFSGLVSLQKKKKMKQENVLTLSIIALRT